MPETHDDSARLELHLGLAVASLVLGIISLPFSLFLYGGIFAVIGCILGAVHLAKRGAFRAMAIWGVVLSVLGIAASGGAALMYYRSYRHFSSAMGGAGAGHGGGDLQTWEGVRCPDITVTTLDGEQIRLSDLRGKRVVLDFWATWCPPCAKEIPHFIRLVTESDPAGLAVFGISSEDSATLAAFVKEKGINYPVASVPDEALPSPFGEIRSIPTTFFVDRNGVIQSVLSGYHDYDALKNAALAEDFAGPVKETADEAGIKADAGGQADAEPAQED